MLLRERLFRGDEFSVDEPFAEAGGPGAGRGLIGFTQTEAVAGAGVDVQLGGDAGAFETQIHFGETLGDIDAVAVAGGEKDGRGAFFRDDLAGSSGINERLKIRPGGGAIDGIGGSGVARGGAHRG